MKNERNSIDRATLLKQTKTNFIENWESIWGTEKDYNEKAEQLKWQEERCNGLEEQEWDEIKVGEVEKALKKAQEWKLRGIDKFRTFWLILILFMKT